MAFSSQVLLVYLRPKSQLHFSLYAHDWSRGATVGPVDLYCVGNTRSEVPQLSPRGISGTTKCLSLERWRLVGGLGLHVDYFPVGKIFVHRTLDLDVDTGWTAQWTLSVLECIRFSFGNPFLENAHQAA